jgi:hypothetical protein
MGGLWRTADGRATAGGTPAAVRAGAYLLVTAILLVGTWYAIQQVG